jgi:protein SCO1/2
MRKTVATLLILVAAFAVAPQAAAELRVVELDEPAEIPAFELADHDGKVFDNARLVGKWSLITIGFTQCPDVCPFVLSNLQATHAEMGLRTRPDNLPQVIFVAVDQKRDEAILKDYVSFFHPDFIGVTGPWDNIATFVKGIDGYAKLGKPDADGNYDVQHTASVIVVAPNGRIVAKLSPPMDPGAVAEYMLRRQIMYRRANQG